MSDILEQINSLTEQFSNLFEVEGLGDPASDVPPSTNKIKKDRKTKDGKVELVSVEDELFPYDGNKREQYRQKIIDTINNMIQGTATLEDLLQIVRQKKMPVKEGFEGVIEILEEIINEVSDKTAQGALDKAKERYNRKGYEASMKLFQGDSKGAIEDGNKAQDEYNKHINMQKRRAERQGKKLVQDKNDHDSFKIEEAQQLSEETINEVSIGKWQEAAASSLPKRKEAFEKTVDNAKKSWDSYAELSKKYPEDEYALYKKAEADTEAQDGAENKADHAYAVTRLQTHKKANANKAIKAAKKVQDKREDEFGRNPEKRTFLRSGKANQLATADPVKSRADEALEEAMELMEDIMTAIDKSNKSSNKKEELKKRAENNQEKELRTLHNYKKLEGSKVPLDIELKRKETKNTKGEHETDERRAKQARSKFKKLGMFDKGYEQARGRFQRALDVEREHSVKEGFEGVIELLEEVINEVSERTKIDAYKKRVAQHQELADRETKIANDYAKLGAYEPAINHLKKASDSQKKEFKHRLNTISHDKKFGQDAFNKAQKEIYDEWKAKNNIKEAQELSELFDRPDLLDDISKALTNKTIKQHLENQAKKLLGGKKKDKRAQEEYDKNKAKKEKGK